MGRAREQDPVGHFGVWLRQQRRYKSDLTQAELAARIGCDRSVIGKVERGERRCPKELCESLLAELGVPGGKREAYVAWARWVGPPPDSAAPLDQNRDQGQLAEQTADQLLAPGTALIRPGEAKEFILVEVGPGGPDVSCRGESCNGKDPGETGCSAKAATAETAEIKDDEGRVVGWVQLRWSELCGTNWARVGNTSGQSDLMVRAYLRDAAGNIMEETVVESRTPRFYSKMRYAPTGQVAVSACGMIEGFEEACTRPV